MEQRRCTGKEEAGGQKVEGARGGLRRTQSPMPQSFIISALNMCHSPVFSSSRIDPPCGGSRGPSKM